MSIRFSPGSRPRTQDWLDQAAGVGIEFPQGSMQEFQFLALCETIWSHGHETGITRMNEQLEANIKSTFAAANQ